MLLFNPVVISVIVMIGLCLINLNIVLALLLAALAGGLAAGMSVPATMGVLIGGMVGNGARLLSPWDIRSRDQQNRASLRRVQKNSGHG